MTNEVAAALVGTGVGGVIGFASTYLLHLLSQGRRDAAVRKQIVNLMRVLEQRMLVVAAHRAVPLDGWVVLDLLTDRVFSTDGANALRGFHDRIFSDTADLQQVRAAIDYTHGKLTESRFVQYGEKIITTEVSDEEIAQRREEIKAAGRRGIDILRDARRELGDTTIVTDPIVNKDDDD
jgi:hypothetical protein